MKLGQVSRMLAGIGPLIILEAQAHGSPLNYSMSQEMRVGQQAMDRGDMAAAVPAFMSAAAKGDSGAQMMLGGLYEWGQGVPRDYTLARRYSLLAANHGWGEAMNDLGVMIWEGRGAPPDHVEGFKWLLLSVRNMAVKHDESSTPIETPEANIEKYRAQMTAEEQAEAERRANAWKPEGIAVP